MTFLQRLSSSILQLGTNNILGYISKGKQRLDWSEISFQILRFNHSNNHNSILCNVSTHYNIPNSTNTITKTPINSTKTVGIVDVSKYACLTGCSKSCLVGRRTADVYCGTGDARLGPLKLQSEQAVQSTADNASCLVCLVG